jgi:hypothetical protein
MVEFGLYAAEYASAHFGFLAQGFVAGAFACPVALYGFAFDACVGCGHAGCH